MRIDEYALDHAQDILGMFADKSTEMNLPNPVKRFKGVEMDGQLDALSVSEYEHYAAAVRRYAELWNEEECLSVGRLIINAFEFHWEPFGGWASAPDVVQLYRDPVQAALECAGRAERGVREHSVFPQQVELDLDGSDKELVSLYDEWTSDAVQKSDQPEME